MTWPDYEAANREFDAVLDTMFGADRKFAIDITSFIWAALGDKVLYEYAVTHDRNDMGDCGNIRCTGNYGPTCYGLVRVWPKEDTT